MSLLFFVTFASAQNIIQTYPVKTHGPVLQKNGSKRAGRLGYKGEEPTTRPAKRLKLGYPGEHSEKNIVATAQEIANLEKFVDLLHKHGLFNYLQSGTYTVFAPSNSAFEKVFANLKNKSPKEIQELLKDHVVKGLYTSDKLPEILETLTGKNIETALIKVGKADIQTSNGVIHIVDEVIEQ